MKGKLKLQYASILEVPFQKYDKDFLFLVNDKEYWTNRIIADILSPKICQIHFTDPTFDVYSIKTEYDGDFQRLLNLINFQSNEIPDLELPFISEILNVLDNRSISFDNGVDDLKLTIDNVFVLLKLHEQYENFYSKQIQTEIDFIASHFHQIKSNHLEKIQSLSKSTLVSILDNKKLRLKSEDHLLTIINYFYSIDNGYSQLYEYVNFSNVTSKLIQEFTKIYDINDITQETWKLLTNRFNQENLTPIQKNDRYYQQGQEIDHQAHSFDYTKGEEFNGIIKHLISISNENIDSVLNVTSSSVNCLHFAKFAINYDNTENFFASENKDSSWICFDFKDHKVVPKNYTIRSSCFAKNSYHPKSWVIEGSNDKTNWTIIDEQNHVQILNGPKQVHTFAVSKNGKEFKYLRLRQTSVNWGDNQHLIIGSVEFFGNLI